MPITVKEGGSINLPITIKKGYIFVGWYTSRLIDGVAVTTPYKPTKDITLYAIWVEEPADANQIIVTFAVNGGSRVVSCVVNSGGSINLPLTTREGYTFKGWYENENQGSSAVTAPYRPTENITLYAKWEINKYTASFDAHGGGAVAPITVDYG